MSHDKTTSRFLTSREVAREYPWSEKTLRHWRSRNVGPRYIKTEGRVFYRREDVERYINMSAVDTYDSARRK